eukprot:2157381-Alexandrium_andersonii.AAC.1
MEGRQPLQGLGPRHPQRPSSNRPRSKGSNQSRGHPRRARTQGLRQPQLGPAALHASAPPRPWQPRSNAFSRPPRSEQQTRGERVAGHSSQRLWE